MSKTLQELMDELDFVRAPDGEECCECNETAVGDLEWSNYRDEWEYSTSTYYCGKHLMERYGDMR